MDYFTFPDGTIESFEGGGTPGSGFPPSGWTQMIYNGTGSWDGGVYGAHSYEPAGGGLYYAEAWDNGDDINVGLFTPAMDMTGTNTVNLIFKRSFQDFAGAGQAAVRTYSSAAMTFEEELLYLDTDDPTEGVHTELMFNPSVYTDPSEVYIEFWYTDDAYSGAWGFAIDDVFVEIPGVVTEYDETVSVSLGVGETQAAVSYTHLRAHET